MGKGLPVLLSIIICISLLQGCGGKGAGIDRMPGDADDGAEQARSFSSGSASPVPGSPPKPVPGAADDGGASAVPPVPVGEAEQQNTSPPPITPAPSPKVAELSPSPTSVRRPARPSPAPPPSPKTVQPKKRQASSESPQPTDHRTSTSSSGARVKAGGGKAQTWGQLSSKYPGSFVLHGAAGKGKQIALTFDDAPDERFTGPILDILKAHQVKATFFIIGTLAREHPELVKRIRQEGHVIGNHTESHAYLPKRGTEAFIQDIEGNERLLESLIGYKPRLFRPPYGAINEEQLQWMDEHHRVVVNWNVDSLDWKGLRADEIVRNITEHAGSGAIVLQHAGIGRKGSLSGTVEALPIVIKELRQKGYELVTLPELLDVKKEL